MKPSRREMEEKAARLWQAGRTAGAPRPAAFEHRQLMLQCNAFPDQCSAGTMICPDSFDDVAGRSQSFGGAYAKRHNPPAFRRRTRS